MADFKSASTWMKLAMLMISVAFSMHLFAMDAPGFGTDQCTASWVGSGANGNGNNGNGWGNGGSYGGYGACNLNAARAVQALEVIGFISVLTALFLVLCLVLLDELQGNKIALIFMVVFALLAGLMIIIGIAVYEGQMAHYPYSSCVGCMAGIASLLGGIFGILEIVGVSPPPVK